MFGWGWIKGVVTHFFADELFLWDIALGGVFKLPGAELLALELEEGGSLLEPATRGCPEAGANPVCIITDELLDVGSFMELFGHG